MNPYQTYAAIDNNIDDGNKPRLLLKVYQGTIDKIDVVKAAIRNKDYEKKYDELTKLITVIEVLESSLDKEQGDVANNLSALYHYLVRRLLTVHTEPNSAVLDECRTLVLKIFDGFSEAYKKELDKSKPKPAEGAAQRSEFYAGCTV